MTPPAAQKGHRPTPHVLEGKLRKKLQQEATRKLAANLTPHPFWYKPVPSPPKDFAKWSALIEALTKHLIARYGKDEVEHLEERTISDLVRDILQFYQPFSLAIGGREIDLSCADSGSFVQVRKVSD